MQSDEISVKTCSICNRTLANNDTNYTKKSGTRCLVCYKLIDNIRKKAKGYVSKGDSESGALERAMNSSIKDSLEEGIKVGVRGYFVNSPDRSERGVSVAPSVSNVVGTGSTQNMGYHQQMLPFPNYGYTPGMMYPPHAQTSLDLSKLFERIDAMDSRIKSLESKNADLEVELGVYKEANGTLEREKNALEEKFESYIAKIEEFDVFRKTSEFCNERDELGVTTGQRAYITSAVKVAWVDVAEETIDRFLLMAERKATEIADAKFNEYETHARTLDKSMGSLYQHFEILKESFAEVKASIDDKASVENLNCYVDMVSGCVDSLKNIEEMISKDRMIYNDFITKLDQRLATATQKVPFTQKPNEVVQSTSIFTARGHLVPNKAPGFVVGSPGRRPTPKGAEDGVVYPNGFPILSTYR